MTANDFFEHFATLADAPGGILKLRELILQSAIQGKLDTQDPSDESAVALLKRIQADKAKLVKAGGAKNQDFLSELGKPPNGLDMPEGWRLVPLQNVCISVTDGDHLPPPKTDEGIPFLVIGNVRWNSIDFTGCRHVSPDYYESLDDIRRPRKGDILYTLVGSFGIPVIVSDDRPFCIQRHIGILRPSPEVSVRYVAYALESPFLFNQAEKTATGIAQKTVPLSALRRLLIPLPPLTEQKRIVAKVDRLMTLCDALEAQQQARHAVRSRLHATLLGNLQTAANAADSARAWQRLRDHFAELCTPGEAALDAVAQLRQTILHLAAQGKLVPQVADDEPVSELLGRVHKERARLVESGALRDAPPLEPIAEKELPFSIPSSWQWVRAGDICQGITSGTTPPQAVFQASPDSAIPYLKVYNIRNQRVDFEYKPQYIAETYHRAKMKRSTLFPGDVIMNIVGPPLGKVAIIPDSFPEWNCNQAIVFFRLLGKVLPAYLHAYLMEGSYLKNIELIGTAGQDNISVTKSKNIVIPLPPLAEQQRIVAKVQQLMAQCDALEASLKAAATVSERWSSAAVRHLLDKQAIR